MFYCLVASCLFYVLVSILTVGINVSMNGCLYALVLQYVTNQPYVPIG